MLNLMFAELDQHIFPSEVKLAVSSSSGPGELEVREENGKQINVTEVLEVAQTTDYSPTLLEKSCFNEVRGSVMGVMKESNVLRTGHHQARN